MTKKLKELFAVATITAGVTTVFQAASIHNAKLQKQADLKKAFDQIREDNKSYLENTAETNRLLTDIKDLLIKSDSLNSSEIKHIIGNLQIISKPDLLNKPDTIASTSDSANTVTNNFKSVADSPSEQELYNMLEDYINNTDTLEFYNYAGFSVLMSTCLLFMCVSTYIFNNYLKDKLDNIKLDDSKKYYGLLNSVINFYKLSMGIENYVLLLGILISTLLLLVVGLCLLLV